MREIKFRAWHKTWSEQEAEWKAKGQKINGMKMVKGLRVTKSGKMRVHLWEWDSDCSLEDVELMQYTGLKDKNGKDIYEGDKLLWLNKTYEPNCEIPFVEFNDGCFVCGNENLCDFDLESMVVIGNKYENPELLIETE